MRIVFFFLLLIAMSCTSNTSTNHYQRTWSQEDRSFLSENLESSIKAVLNEVGHLNNQQWHWKSSDSTWSIAMVIEHLILHDELFYREARVLTGIPEMSTQPDSLFATDEEIYSYKEITSKNTGKAPSYMEPLGRWCSKEDATSAYSRIRNAMIEFVNSSDSDLRRIYTSSGRGPTQYRDLHQLLLISVAHTQRHLQQIQNIKTLAEFPSEEL
ncbi:MAG: DinB family protein [Bacteroidota bacterium]